ncbi:unnamed protein product [Paramecium sonneborni]|uniref:Uncharacterized protein n=1 Tax=Paramecium sonneborni TaxID=65129 RepID=A0A8S1RPH2_9CILI|nr:unnamed protein product [Paramecium sonneborni]
MMNIQSKEYIFVICSRQQQFIIWIIIRRIWNFSYNILHFCQELQYYELYRDDIAVVGGRWNIGSYSFAN